MSNSSRQPRSQTWAFRIAILGGIALLIGEFSYLRLRQISREEARAVASANDLVAAKIETARAHIALQHWDQAIRHLEDALALEWATNRDEARSLLEQAQKGQADALLDAAGTAIAHKDSLAALRLLHAYLAHPRAGKPDRAESLCEELEYAASDEEAARRLEHLSDDALALFQESGLLTEETSIRTAAVQEIFKETLRRNLGKELERRQAKCEAERRAAERRAAERARQTARLRNTPTFRALSAFISQTLVQARDRRELARRQEAALLQLFQQLGVSDPDEQAKVRANLMDGDGLNGIAESVDHQRTEIKRAYRASPEFDEADRGLFDELVDQELDNLLKVLRTS
jgi:hypothetical protein